MGIDTTINGQHVNIGPANGLTIGKESPHRKLIQWNLPGKGLVEMYINPQALSISESKLIKRQRVKGGFVIQYWGEELNRVSIQGTTGSGGIEGINVLRDIFRQEQIAFVDIIKNLNINFNNNLSQLSLNVLQDLTNNPLANPINTAIQSGTQLANGASLQQVVTGVGNQLVNNGTQLFNDVTSLVGNIANAFDTLSTSIGSDQSLIPTLGALATSVELWYDGLQMRGYFEEFSVDEKADNIGLFSYSMKFVVTRRLGKRLNGFPWQRSATSGPANADTIPLSFGGLLIDQPTSAGSAPTTPATTGAPPLSRRSLLTGG